MTECFNETIFLLVSYHMMLFSSTWAYDKRALLGKTLILAIVLMIVTNYTIIIILTLKIVARKLRMWYYRRKKAKIVEQRNNELERIFKERQKLRILDPNFLFMRDLLQE